MAILTTLPPGSGRVAQLLEEMMTEWDALAAHRSQAGKSWQAARARAEFILFAPYLERYVVLNRQLYAAIGYADHPYDGMLLRYEPDMTVARLQPRLGVVLPDDSVGVLQDIHWSFGQMGTFPAYTIGNVMAAQIFAAAEAQIARLAEQLAAGEYGELLAWLQHHIYRHGRAYNADELLRQVAGGPLQTAPYLAYLSQKYRAPYDLA